MSRSSSQTLVLDVGLRSWRRGKDVSGGKVVNIFSGCHWDDAAYRCKCYKIDGVQVLSRPHSFHRSDHLTAYSSSHWHTPSPSLTFKS